MRWLFAGCCGIALINLSVALQVYQSPRFYGVKTKQSVPIYCGVSEQHQHTDAQWYKASEYTEGTANRHILRAGPKIDIYDVKMRRKALLYLRDLGTDASGVYYCRINDEWGPGTELQVVRPFNLEQAIYRSKMRDGLILLQGLLLAVCITAVLVRRRTLMKKSDSIYEEPETDHIYEGLAIETCGVDLYEDISMYAQVDGAEATWERD